MNKISLVLMTVTILFFFWFFTLINFRGLKISGRISSIGVIIGTILPGLIIISLGITWVFEKHPIAAPLNFLPDFSVNNMIFLTAIFFSLAGIEMSAVHAREVENPQKNYPRAILVGGIIIFSVFLLGALAISVIIPKKEIDLVCGTMQAFDFFFVNYNLPWMTKGIAVLTALGALTLVSTWIIGPPKGLAATALNGSLPPIFQKRNKRNIPVNLLIFQALVFTLLTLVFFFMPSVKSSYWMLATLAVQLYLFMYLLMFLSALILRSKDAARTRPYRTPFLPLFAILGIIGALFGIGMAFIPPSKLEMERLGGYVGFLVGGIIVLSSIPFIILRFKKPSWISKERE